MITLVLVILALLAGLFFGAMLWHLHLKRLLNKNPKAFGDAFEVNIREVYKHRVKMGGFGLTVTEYEMEDRDNER